MIDAMGRELASWILAANLWTAAVLVVALVADRWLRRFVSPSGRMLLFAAVLARLALPLDFASPLGLAPALEQGSLVLPQIDATAVPTATTAAAPTIADAPTQWGVAVLAAYAMGVIALACALVGAHRRLRRSLRTGGRERVVPGGSLVIEHVDAGPLAAGGRVVIPRRLFRELSPAELLAVARHERAHLRHRDPLLVTALAMVCVIAWPVLAVWIAAHRIRFLVELRADATAVAGLDAVGREVYRKVMLRVAALGWRAPVHAPGFGPVSALEARLAALHGVPRGPLWLQLGVTVTIVGVVLCCAARGEPEDVVEIAAAAPKKVACAVPIRGTEHEPTDPELVAASARLRAELAQSPERILAEAERLHLRRVAAEARLVLGQQLFASGEHVAAREHLEEAAWLGASTAHDGIAAVASGDLVTLHFAMGDSEGALAWHRHHEAARRRVVGEEPLRREAPMLEALIAHYEAIGQPIADLQARLALVRERCG